MLCLQILGLPPLADVGILGPRTGTTGADRSAHSALDARGTGRPPGP